jgi:membrane-bound lytic murein transglycosylase D
MKRNSWKRLVFGCLLFVSWSAADGQTVPQVSFDVEFAGVTVHINEAARTLIQQEINTMYADRPALLRDLEALRQLTPLLEARLADDRLPIDFRYASLPFGNSPDVGYWGLTIAEAGKLTLRIDPSVDERLHPILSTDAVVDRLSELQLQSGNYAQTLLYYLQGVSPADRKPGSRYATYLLLTEKNPPLLWKILARKFVVEREEPTFRPGQLYVLFDYPNGSGQTIASIARQLAIDEDRFEPFNQWLKTTVIPTDKRYPVLVRVTAEEFPQVRGLSQTKARTGNTQPADVGFPVLVKKPLAPTSLYGQAVYYSINGLPGVQAQSCDNVITLAYYGKRSVDRFVADNDLTTQDVILPGQIYYLARKAKRAKIPFHVIQRGQTLREVANMYGVRLKSLLKFNRIPANQRVQTGRIVWLQRKRPARRPVEYQQLPETPRQYDTRVDDPVAVTQPVTPASDTLVQRTVIINPAPSATRSTTATAPVRTDPAPASTVRTGQTAAPAKRIVPSASLSATSKSVEISAQRPAKASPSEPSVSTTAPVQPDTAQAEPREIVRLHIVKAGQTYLSIARQYGVAVGQLYAWNNLSERYPLEAGQEIIVGVVKVPASIVARPATRQPSKAAPVAEPRPTAVVTAAPASSVSAPTADTKVYYHVVQPGQTAYRIALINKVPVNELARWNNLKNYTIEVGQRLIIRKK